jgi:hypothetical protein
MEVTWHIVTVPEWQLPFRRRAGRTPPWNHDEQEGPPQQVITEAKALIREHTSGSMKSVTHGTGRNRGSRRDHNRPGIWPANA